MPALLCGIGLFMVHAEAAPQPTQAQVFYSPGDLVRVARKETLQLKGEPFLGAPKGQEFTVLRHEKLKGPVVLAFLQK